MPKKYKWKYLGWVTIPSDNQPWPTVQVGPKRYVRPEGRTSKEAEENARLIAEAQEMLELLQLASALLANIRWYSDKDFFGQINRAERFEWFEKCDGVLERLEKGRAEERKEGYYCEKDPSISS